MQNIVSSRLGNDLSVIISIRNVLVSSINARLVQLASLSGYPVATHVVGQIHSRLRLESMNTLLESILHLRDLTRLASDILESIGLARMDKHQLVKSELLSYIKLNANTFGYKEISDTDAEFITSMIVSSETPDAAWVLNMSPHEDNIYLKFNKLFDSLITTEMPSAGTSSTDEDGDLGIRISKTDFFYDGTTGGVVSLADVADIKDVLLTIKTLPDDEATAKRTEVLNVLTNQATVLRLSHLRLVDHVMAMITSVDIWDTFITPRNSSAVASAQNAERAHGLRLLSGYLHGLLMYYTNFSVEAFRTNYERLQEWLTALPAIDPVIMQSYRDVVVANDVLNAAGDVAELFTDTVIAEAGTIKVKRHFFSEFTKLFGLAESETKAIRAAEGVSTTIDITSLTELISTDKFSTVLMSAPISTITAVQNFADTMMFSNTVKRLFKDTIVKVMAGIPRYISNSSVTALAAAKLRVPYKAFGKISVSPGFTETSANTVENNKLYFNRNIPFSSYRYGEYMKNEKRMTLMNLRSIQKNAPGLDTSKFIAVAPFIYNHDLADSLCKILGVSWTALMPHCIADGDRLYNASTFKIGRNEVNMLIEMIGGTNAEIIRQTIHNEYVAKMWATYFSSFAILYRVTKKVGPSSKNLAEGETSSTSLLKEGASVVSGYGKPYGLGYEALASLQTTGKPIDSAHIIPLIDDPGVDQFFLLLLNKIPLPTRLMSTELDFFDHHPHYYFVGSSSQSIDITEFKYVTAPGGLNFAMAGIHSYDPAPLPLITKKFVYLNDALLLQSNLAYKTPAAEKIDVGIGMVARTRVWNRTTFLPFVEYRDFGGYGSAQEAREQKIDDAAKKVVENIETTITEIETRDPGRMIHDNPPSAQPVPTIDTTLTSSSSESSVDSNHRKSNKSRRKSKAKGTTIKNEKKGDKEVDQLPTNRKSGKDEPASEGDSGD